MLTRGSYLLILLPYLASKTKKWNRCICNFTQLCNINKTKSFQDESFTHLTWIVLFIFYFLTAFLQKRKWTENNPELNQQLTYYIIAMRLKSMTKWLKYCILNNINSNTLYQHQKLKIFFQCKRLSCLQEGKNTILSKVFYFSFFNRWSVNYM